MHDDPPSTPGNATSNTIGSKTNSTSLTPNATAPEAHAESEPDAKPRRGEPRTLLTRVLEYFLPGANSKEELIELLADAEDNEVIAAESRVMLEGVLRLTEMYAGDVLVAAPRMDAINIKDDPVRILDFVIDTAHSRFPVHEGNSEHIIGILHAKDLLKLHGDVTECSLYALLRPAVFIPESKPLNDVLREFRASRNHLAMVIDEFGRVAGLITIEDVVEEIVGDIEDEFDIPEGNTNDIFSLSGHAYRVSGDAAIKRVDETFGVQLQTSDGETFDTIGGLVAHEMGHVPKRGERFSFGGLHFSVLHTDGGVVRWFRIWQDETSTG